MHPLIEARMNLWVDEASKFIVTIDKLIKENDPEEVATLTPPSKNLLEGAELVQAFKTENPHWQVLL